MGNSHKKSLQQSSNTNSIQSQMPQQQSQSLNFIQQIPQQNSQSLNFIQQKSQKKSKANLKEQQTSQFQNDGQIQQIIENYEQQDKYEIKKCLQLVKFNGEDLSLPVVALVLTFFGHQSYDNLFRDVPQKVADGRVVVYSADNTSTDKIYQALNAHQKGKIDELEQILQSDESLKEFFNYLNQVKPESVLFNWECCAQVSTVFPDKASTMQLLVLLIRQSYTLMFSDFAIKSLMDAWTIQIGPNPLISFGTVQGQVKIKFSSQDLKKCNCQQLEILGDLSENGETIISTMGGTVLFGIDQQIVNSTQDYKYTPLTVMEKTTSMTLKKDHEKHFITLQHASGPVGHIKLEYPSGALLFLSSGHWISLVDVQVSDDQILKVAQERYGTQNEYMSEIEQIRSEKVPEVEKKRRKNDLATRFIQQTCNVQKFSK